jgi:hypothetical protein
MCSIKISIYGSCSIFPCLKLYSKQSEKRLMLPLFLKVRTSICLLFSSIGSSLGPVRQFSNQEKRLHVLLGFKQLSPIPHPVENISINVYHKRKPLFSFHYLQFVPNLLTLLTSWEEHHVWIRLTKTTGILTHVIFFLDLKIVWLVPRRCCLYRFHFILH